jgi:hypothetical protein
MRNASIVAAVALALTLAACSEKEEASAPATPAAPTPTAAPTPAPVPPPTPAQTSQAEADPQQKLNLYIDCYNRASDSFGRSLQRYASWIKNMDVGPTGQERVVYGLYSVQGAEDCQKAVAQAQALPPAMPALDQAAVAFTTSLAPLQKTITEAYAYYDRENYKDDGFAKGKALHKPLDEQARAFHAANDKFSDALDDANDAQQRAHLAQMEKEGGRNLAYYHLATMIQSKMLLRLLTQEQPDIAKIGENIDALEKTIDDMSKVEGEKPMMWSSYESRVDSFRKAAKELWRRQRDKTPYSTGERSLVGTSGGWMVPGSPDKLVHDYNEMVAHSNRLR